MTYGNTKVSDSGENNYNIIKSITISDNMYSALSIRLFLSDIIRFMFHQYLLIFIRSIDLCIKIVSMVHIFLTHGRAQEFYMGGGIEIGFLVPKNR